MPATNRQALRNIAQQGLPLRLGIVGTTLLEPDDRFPGGQHTAVQADELLAKLVFEVRQRLVEQVFTVTRTGHDVLQVSLEKEDGGDRNQQQTTTLVVREVRTRTLRQPHQPVSVKRSALRDFLQSGKQTRCPHRFQEIIYGIEFEGAHGVNIKGGHKNHRRWMLELRQMMGQFNSIHTRHADVHQRHVNATAIDRGQSAQAVVCFGNDFVRQLVRDIGQQVTQARTRRSFVVDDDH